MPTYTPIFGFAKPLVNNTVDRDKWGDQINTNADLSEAVLKFMRHGECRLSWNSGTGNLELNPYNGNKLIINSIPVTIPDAGVTLSAAGATPSTNYFIYAYVNAGTLTLEYSTTTYQVQPTTGIVIKASDPTRTLVGYARAVTGPAWVDNPASRLVLSWFNQTEKYITQSLTIGNVTNNSRSPVEIWTGLRCEFLTWGAALNGVVETPIVCSAVVLHGNTTLGALCDYGLAIDNPVTGTIEGAIASQSMLTADNVRYSLPIPATPLEAVQGYHYITLNTYSSAGTNTTVGAAADVRRTSVKVQIWG